FTTFKQQLATNNLKLEAFELFDSWVDTFLEIYTNAKSSDAYTFDSDTILAEKSDQTGPNVVITDFLDISTPVELERFAKHFESRNLQVEICDIRELKFENAAECGPILTTPSGMKVDAVYRRAVTGDIMKHYDKVTDFLDAYRAGAFTLIGSFRTQLPHTKLSFEVLHLPETLALLTAKEQEFVKTHVPYTFKLNTGHDEINTVIAEKDSWIVKPLDSYGSKGVWAGRELTQVEWKKLVSEGAHNGSLIAQEYIEQYEAENLEGGFVLPAQKEPIENDELPKIRKYRDLTGLFVYGGQFKGLLARAGLQDRICAAAAGKCLGTFKVLDTY
ncbi:MAG: hypothetical protein FWD93_04905, partial [Coriobacteriia bacterium]|nr:hypothetical protein [Coriobacteriia bacterium]